MNKNNKEAGHKFLARLGKKRLRPGGKFATRWLLNEAQITSNSKVLEVACNMGTTLIEVANLFGCNVIGIDMDRNALLKAQQNIDKNKVSHLVSIQKADASKLPFSDNSFDVVINEAMLTMYSNKAKSHLLKEYFRVLKPGGKLLTHDIMLIEPNKAFNVVKQIHKAINVNAQPISKKEWEKLFINTGFTSIKIKNDFMTLMSPIGMIVDEGILGTYKIIKNALKKENRKQFFKMFNTFRRNRYLLNYIAICSTKPK